MTPQEMAAKAAEMKAKMDKSNPAQAPGPTPAERKRVPMSLPVQKLQVPEIPGYHLHWMRGTAQRLAQAERAGYEFVDPSEIDVNSVQLGGDATHSGNTDLGGRVSIVGGSELGGDGQVVRLYLMKQKLEYYYEDQKVLQGRNDSVADALTAAYQTGQVGGRVEGETSEDAQARYVDRSRTRIPELFRRKGLARRAR